MLEQIKVLKYYLYYKYFLRMGSRRRLKKWQERKIQRHLVFVGKKSKIYRGKKDLKEYPIVNKQFMMTNFDRLNTVGIRKKEAEAFAVRAERDRNFVPKLRKITVGLSSGTSGKRGIFLVSDKERVRWAGYILARFLPGSILGKYSIAFFMRADSNLYQSLGSRRIQFHFFDIYRKMEEHQERLTQAKPDILVGQPSVLLMLADEMKRKHFSIIPKVVISIAEVLERGDEERLKAAFQVEVIHQVYQCTEGCLATTCRCGTLHLNEDIVHIEREYLDEYRFVPIVTDFERRAQPIIRYRLNDILIERKNPCSCGSPCLALEKIEGREDDVFFFEGKKGKERVVFPDFIRRCILFAENENGESASDYRVVQESDRTIVVYEDLTEEGKERVRQEFEKLAEETELILPKIAFQPYKQEPGRKMKRVERKFQTEEKA